MAKRIVVVGAGLGGLSAAAHLIGDGHDVTVVEASNQPGGKAGTMTIGDYRFDTGPTVLTMPDLVDRCFNALGYDSSDFVQLRKVDPLYRAVYADGSELRVRSDRDEMIDEIQKVCGARDANNFEAFCVKLRTMYELEMPNFIERNYNSVTDLARPIAPAMKLLRAGGFGRLHNLVNRYFDDQRLHRLFSFQSMYAGLAPYEALALYSVITYMDVVNGVYFPEGGMSQLSVGMANAVTKAGGDIRYNSRIDRVSLQGRTSGRVNGVVLDSGETISADVVVCNAEVGGAYRQLIPGAKPPRASQKGNYSPSCVVWHVGVKGELPQGTDHHNIYFGEQWDESFRQLIKQRRLMSDPSRLITVPSIDAPEMAPQGSSVLYVLEPVPNLDGAVDWQSELPRKRDELCGWIEGLGYPVTIEAEQVVGPRQWRAAGCERGTPFSLSHQFFQTGPFRPNNIDCNIEGLVFTGASTVPGVGVPMVLISGMLAAERVAEIDGNG